MLVLWVRVCGIGCMSCRKCLLWLFLLIRLKLCEVLLLFFGWWFVSKLVLVYLCVGVFSLMFGLLWEDVFSVIIICSWYKFLWWLLLCVVGVEVVGVEVLLVLVLLLFFRFV